jgi:hypothetical protein
MKRFAGLAVMAGMMFAASAANAQMAAPYRGVSDFDGPYERPYGAVPPAPAPPAYNSPPVYNYGGYGPSLLPLPEVYAVLRDNGFSPLGAPYQRGLVYMIAAMDRNGQDGRLVIDARNGRIIRFTPAYGYGRGYGYGNPAPYGGNFAPEQMSAHGREHGPDATIPPPIVIRGVPRPPAPVPHVASRTVPVPAPKPAIAAKPAEPAPQQSAAIEARPATPAASAPPAAQASAPPTSTVGEAKPAPVIRPTQQMPAAQGLE